MKPLAAWAIVTTDGNRAANVVLGEIRRVPAANELGNVGRKILACDAADVVLAENRPRKSCCHRGAAAVAV